MKLMQLKTAVVVYASLATFSILSWCWMAWSGYVVTCLFYLPVVGFNVCAFVGNVIDWRRTPR